MLPNITLCAITNLTIVSHSTASGMARAPGAGWARQPAAAGVCSQPSWWGPPLTNPTTKGAGVKTFCSEISKCDQGCPAGAKGPGWYIPGGNNDGRAELRWNGVELNKHYFTVAMWVKRDDRRRDIGLFSYGQYPHHKGFMLQMRNRGDLHIRASCAAFTNCKAFKAYDSGQVSPDWSDEMLVHNWAHIAIVKDGDTAIRYYINGRQVGKPNTRFQGKPRTMPGKWHFNVGSWYEGTKILKGYVSNVHVEASDTDTTRAFDDSAVWRLYAFESAQSCSEIGVVAGSVSPAGPATQCPDICYRPRTAREYSPTAEACFWYDDPPRGVLPSGPYRLRGGLGEQLFKAEVAGRVCIRGNGSMGVCSISAMLDRNISTFTRLVPTGLVDVPPSEIASGCDRIAGRKCSNKASDWHESTRGAEAQHRASGCERYAKTGGKSCSDWCYDQGSTCIRAQDNTGEGCWLDSRHTRKSTDKFGCEQKWGDQICVCEPQTIQKEMPWITLALDDPLYDHLQPNPPVMGRARDYPSIYSNATALGAVEVTAWNASDSPKVMSLTCCCTRELADGRCSGSDPKHGLSDTEPTAMLLADDAWGAVSAPAQTSAVRRWTLNPPLPLNGATHCTLTVRETHSGLPPTLSGIRLFRALESTATLCSVASPENALQAHYPMGGWPGQPLPSGLGSHSWTTTTALDETQDAELTATQYVAVRGYRGQEAGATRFKTTGDHSRANMYVLAKGGAPENAFSLSMWFRTSTRGQGIFSVVNQEEARENARHVFVNKRGQISVARTQPSVCDASSVADCSHLAGFEVGSSTSNQHNARSAWQSVRFQQTYYSPVVIAGIPSSIGDDEVVVSIKDVTSTGFQFHLHETSCRDGAHVDETVAWLVAEAGTHTIGGKKFVFGKRKKVAASVWTTINFTGFSAGAKPTILSQIQDAGISDYYVNTRHRNADHNSFQVRTQSANSASGTARGDEVVGYCIIESGPSQTAKNLSWVAGITANVHTNSKRPIDLGHTFANNKYALFGKQHTFDGSDPAALRYTAKKTHLVTVYVQEESCTDSEVVHTTEKIAYFAIETGIVECSCIPAATFANVADGQWHHLVYSSGKTYGEFVYLDGTVVHASQKMDAGGWHAGIGFAIGLHYGAQTEGVKSFYTGEVDEVMIFSKALGAAEVTALRGNVLGTTTNLSLVAGSDVNCSETETMTDGEVGARALTRIWVGMAAPCRSVQSWNDGSTISPLHGTLRVVSARTNVSAATLHACKMLCLSSANAHGRPCEGVEFDEPAKSCTLVWDCGATQVADGTVRVANGSAISNNMVSSEELDDEGTLAYRHVVTLSPEVAYAGDWYPICGYYFWENKRGADLVCKALGLGAAIDVVKTQNTLWRDAMPIGMCSANDQALVRCNGGGNAWGNLRYRGGSCAKGNPVSVHVKCRYFSAGARWQNEPALQALSHYRPASAQRVAADSGKSPEESSGSVQYWVRVPPQGCARFRAMLVGLGADLSGTLVSLLRAALRRTIARQLGLTLQHVSLTQVSSPHPAHAQPAEVLLAFDVQVALPAFGDTESNAGCLAHAVTDGIALHTRNHSAFTDLCRVELVAAGAAVPAGFAVLSTPAVSFVGPRINGCSQLPARSLSIPLYVILLFLAIVLVMISLSCHESIRHKVWWCRRWPDRAPAIRAPVAAAAASAADETDSNAAPAAQEGAGLHAATTSTKVAVLPAERLGAEGALVAEVMAPDTLHDFAFASALLATVEITLPRGAQVGDVIEVTGTPSGAVLHARVPPGYKPGSTMVLYDEPPPDYEPTELDELDGDVLAPPPELAQVRPAEATV